jgi:battenin
MLFFVLKGKNSVPVVDNTTRDNTTRECNPTSTGAILLADILPSLTVKILAPFLPFLVQ